MMQADKPQYIKLYELLKKNILNGTYQEGYILPSENSLSATHSLTRPTVRRALDQLLNEGYIEKHQGKGSIVKSEPKQLGIMTIEGVTSAVKNKNLKTVIIEKPTAGNWPNSFQYKLSDLEKELGCISIQRLRYVDNKPVFFDKNYLPNLDLPRFTNRNLENKSLFGILREHYNIEIKGGEQILRAIIADKTISENLNVKKGAPILHLARKLTTNKKDFNIYSSLYCNTDQFRLHGIF